MASEVIAFPVNIRKNMNQYNSAFGKYYAEADAKEPLNLKGFARHLSEHGKLVDYPMAVLVLQNIVACMKEMAVQGQPVKLDGFGTFTPIIESDGKKAVNTVEEALNVGIDNLIAGVHLRFIPENAKGEQLTSRAITGTGPRDLPVKSGGWGNGGHLLLGKDAHRTELVICSEQGALSSHCSGRWRR